jgi:hypothetical protein
MYFFNNFIHAKLASFTVTHIMYLLLICYNLVNLVINLMIIIVIREL